MKVTKLAGNIIHPGWCHYCRVTLCGGSGGGVVHARSVNGVVVCLSCYPMAVDTALTDEKVLDNPTPEE